MCPGEWILLNNPQIVCVNVCLCVCVWEVERNGQRTSSSRYLYERIPSESHTHKTVRTSAWSGSHGSASHLQFMLTLSLYTCSLNRSITNFNAGIDTLSRVPLYVLSM